jgi:hypothetical protein
LKSAKALLNDTKLQWREALQNEPVQEKRVNSIKKGLFESGFTGLKDY